MQHLQELRDKLNNKILIREGRAEGLKTEGRAKSARFERLNLTEYSKRLKGNQR